MPSAWKEDAGLFLRKPGGERYFEAKSFRMTTLTSFQLKWLKRLILYHVNEDNNVQAKLSASQYGFRAGISSETALHKFVRRVEHCLVRKKPTLLQMPADQIKKTKVFERNFERQIMDKTDAIRSESAISQHTVKVYTEGSKLDGRAGAGFYTEYPNNSPKQAFFHLGIHSTVFQAKVLAIPEVAKNLLFEKMHNQSIVVLVDSQAAIKSLMKCTRTSITVLNCIRNLNQFGKQNHVRIAWIPGNAKVHAGNKVADYVAKSGSKSEMHGPEPFFTVPYASCFSTV